jgi:hypothetical protein
LQWLPRRSRVVVLWEHCFVSETRKSQVVISSSIINIINVFINLSDLSPERVIRVSLCSGFWAQIFSKALHFQIFVRRIHTVDASNWCLYFWLYIPNTRLLAISRNITHTFYVFVICRSWWSPGVRIVIDTRTVIAKTFIPLVSLCSLHRHLTAPFFNHSFVSEGDLLVYSRTQTVILKLVVCILLRVLGQVQGFRLTQHWFEYFIQ